jgi:hypothetical protein
MKSMSSASISASLDKAGNRTPLDRPGMGRPAAAAGRQLAWVFCLPLAAAAACLTGCQVDVGGQTLPSAYYLQDDIQYFPAGPEFKLAKEAAAQKAYKKELAANDGRPPR